MSVTPQAALLITPRAARVVDVSIPCLFRREDKRVCSAALKLLAATPAGVLLSSNQMLDRLRDRTSFLSPKAHSLQLDANGVMAGSSLART